MAVEQASVTRFPLLLGGEVEQVEQIYRNKYNIYNPLFYNVYYGTIGKRRFTPRWRCVSYMEIAPLLHLWPPVYTPFMKKVLNITERKRETNVHHYCKSDDLRARLEVAKWRMFWSYAQKLVTV